MKLRHAVLGLLAIAALALPAYGQNAQNSSPTVGGWAENASTVNSSVTITTGGTFQQVLPSILGTSTRRQSLTIQNNNGNPTCEAAANCDYCYMYLGSGTASEGKAIELAAGQAYTRYWPYVPSDAIQATCTSSSDTLYVDTQ